MKNDIGIRETAPFSVEILRDPEDRQFLTLENNFLAEIGEEALTEKKQERLTQAIRDGRIVFFMAKQGCRWVGMCSVSRCFSTFTCTDTGVFDDFYIEPVFRGKGIARLLTRAAFDWCETNGFGSVSVCCAPCDEPMYQALGFDTSLGKSFVKLI
ncbi:MAG: GNAT family N-acetyltransferase [Faecousia sp.]